MKNGLSQSRRSLLVRQDTFLIVDGDQSDDVVDYDHYYDADQAS